LRLHAARPMSKATIAAERNCRNISSQCSPPGPHSGLRIRQVLWMAHRPIFIHRAAIRRHRRVMIGYIAIRSSLRIRLPPAAGGRLRGTKLPLYLEGNEGGPTHRSAKISPRRQPVAAEASTIRFPVA
jgi:hypothetical protein